MTYDVSLKDIHPQFYNYLRHALHEESGGKPLWQLDHFDQGAFEDKWFNDRGIKVIRIGKTVNLGFGERERFIKWLLTWS